MEKKLYMMPLTEVEKIRTLGMILSSSEDDYTPEPMDDPSHPGAPKHRTPVF